ncbi:chromosome partitioning protein ParB [Cereibacter sphaeroides]|nr:chromosome partitioning protein ParB [Cereibacter sphaeroides]AZB61955.1 chromosome partitioning protein ParB [Cereibacter sphaeroides]
MQIEKVAVSEVLVRNRMRPVSDAGVKSLIASVTETGVMKDAIHVRKKKDGKLYLIAGAHRLEAARLMGWDEIPAKVWTDATDDWARLMEIDDNLAGAEMNALDTAIFLAARKQIYERLHPETRQHVAGGLARQGLANDIVSFAAATAEKFGISQRHVERMVAAGRALGPDQTAALRAAPRPVTLKDLTEIAKICAATERYDVVRLLAAGEAKSAAQARRALDPARGIQSPFMDPVEEAHAGLLKLWKRAPMEARRRFTADIATDMHKLLDDLEGHSA